MKRHRKWLRWLGILVALFAFAAATALVLVPASAGGLPFSWKIRSNLSADYRYGETTASLGIFRLSIIGDVLRDMGLGDKEATQRENVMKLVMEASVPTATAFDFEGNPPLTATPTYTATPTNTPTSTPTSTATNTPRPTATRTKTPKPTNTPKPPTSTSGPSDGVAPSVCCVTYLPAPGPSDPGPSYTDPSCKITVSAVDIFDPAFSSGVPSDGVCVEYKDLTNGSTDYAVLAMDPGSGFAAGPGSDWNGTFSGSIIMSGINVGDQVKIKIKGHDNAGNWFYSSYQYFTVDTVCP